MPLGILITAYVDEQGVVRSEAHEVDVTPEAALARVLEDERNDLDFDRSSAETSDMPIFDDVARAIESATWTPAANDDRTMILPSPTNGGIDEGGFEWRFVPVDRAA